MIQGIWAPSGKRPGQTRLCLDLKHNTVGSCMGQRQCFMNSRAIRQGKELGPLAAMLFQDMDRQRYKDYEPEFLAAMFFPICHIYAYYHAEDNHRHH